MAETILIVWGWLAFFNLVIRSSTLYLVFHGRVGEDTRQKYVMTASRYGGIVNYAAAAIAVGIVLAPFAFIASMRAVGRLWE